MLLLHPAKQGFVGAEHYARSPPGRHPDIFSTHACCRGDKFTTGIARGCPVKDKTYDAFVSVGSQLCRFLFPAFWVPRLQ